MRRKVCYLFLFAFALSLLFPVIAATVGIGENRLIGYVDLALAALLVSFAIYINVSRKRIKPKAAEKAAMMYRFILAIPMVLIAIYLFGIPLRWNVLIIGLGWRFWILSFVMEDITSVFMKRRKEILAY